MAQKPDAGRADPEKREEAKHLAEEAIEELKHGDKEEGKFLAEEAKALDPAGAAEVLKQGGGKTKSEK